MVNPLQAALVRKSAEDGESAVEHAHRGKVRKNGERCAAEGIVFVPLAVDTLGGWHPSVLGFLARLGRQVASNVGREGQDVVMDNVAMLCARTPSFPPPEVDGDVE